MSIYKVNSKNIHKYLKEFGKTYYGKVTFTVSYGPTLIILFMGIILIQLFKENAPLIFIITVFLMMTSVFNGTKHYYKELKEYLKEEK